MNSQPFIDNEVIQLFKKQKLQHSIIVVVFKGKKKITKLLRSNASESNSENQFSYKKSHKNIFFNDKKNPSIKDGAILIQLDQNIPILRGVSYRLFPPALRARRLKNKGSGYNSAFDFSGVKRVICVYFINKNGVKKFIKGKEKNII